MKHKHLGRIGHYYCAIIDHLSSRWYKLFLGHVGKGTLIRNHCRLEGDCLDNVFIGDSCDIDSYCIIGSRSRLVQDGQKVIPELHIGNGCVFGQYNHITAVNRIIIGDNLLTGRFVLISDNTHGGMSVGELKIHPSARPVQSKGEVVIGNNVWIADKVSILPGVNIGDGCVIGANSVVTHDIPPYSLAAGSPARILKFLGNNESNRGQWMY